MLQHMTTLQHCAQAMQVVEKGETEIEELELTMRDIREKVEELTLVRSQATKPCCTCASCYCAARHSKHSGFVLLNPRYLWLNFYTGMRWLRFEPTARQQTRPGDHRGAQPDTQSVLCMNMLEGGAAEWGSFQVGCAASSLNCAEDDTLYAVRR